MPRLAARVAREGGKLGLMRRWIFAGLLGVGVVAGACRPAGVGIKDPGEGGDAGSCASAEQGRARVAELRGATLDEAERLAVLDGACERGCAQACVEYGRRSATLATLAAYAERACAAGEPLGCSIAELPSGAVELCASDEWLGCAAAVGEAEDRAQAWAELESRARAACDALDARACTVAAWARCAGPEGCDADALALASRAVELGPPTGALEAQAALSCASADVEAADAALAASCAAGVSGDCERSCERFGELSLLVRAREHEDLARVGLLLNLQAERTPAWLALTSVMNAEELADFEALVEAFTPPRTEAAAKVTAPAAVREAHPVLVEAILRSPQVDAKKAKYWFGRLPDMDDEQRHNLFESLRNQWWVIPGEDSATPEQQLDTVATRVLLAP